MMILTKIRIGGKYMLTKCPECELQVSDKAIDCPHCGYPLKQDSRQPRKQRRTTHPKLPNGFGQICKLNNPNLRNPYRAMVTVGRNELGRYNTKIIGYYDTYNHAYEALVDYNRSPYDLDINIKMSELYERWSKVYFENTSESSQKSMSATWRYCSSLYTMNVKNVRTRHLKGCIQDGYIIKKGEKKKASANMQTLMKCLFNLLFDYAVEYEIADKNYARDFSLSNDIKQERESIKKGHIIFTDEELQILWDNVNKLPYVDLVLIQIYSGWRPQELGLIKLDRVDLSGGFFIGGLKTDAGIDRTVPIHSKILPLVQQRYQEATQLGSKYIFNYINSNGKYDAVSLTYRRYHDIYKTICDTLGLNPEHRAHDPRMQFVTMAKKYKVDQFAIKYIVGHKINDVTEKVYTKREPSWLKTEIEKIE